ncbi:unnamed protein product [Symbiodinium sp. KB8]|nr:unnamed protein product [Symbiodinium sp. KB8]
MPFCALQRNKHTRRKDAALRQDEEIFALVRWLRGLLELSVAELPTVVGGHEARDCVSGHEDLFLMSELWLQNLVDHGFLLQHVDDTLAARQPALPQQSSLQLLAAQTLQQQRQQVTAYHPGMHPGQGMPLPYHGLGMPAAPWRQTGFNPTAMYPARAPHGQAAPVASHLPTHAAGAPGQVSAWHPPPPAAPRPYTATGSSLHDTEISDLVTAWHGPAGSAASNPLTKALAYATPPAAPSSASTSGTELKQAPPGKVPPIAAFEGAPGGAAAGSKVATPPIGAQAVTFFGE